MCDKPAKLKLCKKKLWIPSNQKLGPEIKEIEMTISENNCFERCSTAVIKVSGLGWNGYIWVINEVKSC